MSFALVATSQSTNKNRTKKMAHLLPCYSYISTNTLFRESSNTTKLTTRSCRDSSNLRRSEHYWNNKGCVVDCFSTTSNPSLSISTPSKEEVRIEDRGSLGEQEREIDYLVSEFGWKVRRLIEEEYEMREVAQIQAEAFHTPMALFDDLFYEFFKAEVHAGLVYKLRNSPADRYACLVAEPVASSARKLVGIVDVTALRDEEVLQHLRGAEEYLYISGIAVSKPFRRRKIGSTLLNACDVLAIIWGFEYLALRAYEDDMGARRLYSNAGYKVVSSDPMWLTWMDATSKGASMRLLIMPIEENVKVEK